MGVRINTIMQTCFFKLANVIPADEAIAQIKDAIKKTYGKKGGGKIVEQNNAAVDGALAALARGEVSRARSPRSCTWCRRCRPMPRRSSRTCWA